MIERLVPVVLALIYVAAIVRSPALELIRQVTHPSYFRPAAQPLFCYAVLP